MKESLWNKYGNIPYSRDKIKISVWLLYMLLKLILRLWLINIKLNRGNNLFKIMEITWINNNNNTNNHSNIIITIITITITTTTIAITTTINTNNLNLIIIDKVVWMRNFKKFNPLTINNIISRFKISKLRNKFLISLKENTCTKLILLVKLVFVLIHAVYYLKLKLIPTILVTSC